MKVVLEIEFDIDVDEKHKNNISGLIFRNISETLSSVMFIDGEEDDAFVEGYELLKAYVKKEK